MVNKLQTWMTKSSAGDKKLLAQRANTTVASLRQAAWAYSRGGVVDVSPEFAARIEAALTMPGYSEGLPSVDRKDISLLCKKCKYKTTCGG